MRYSEESLRTRYTNFVWGFTGEPQEMLAEGGRVVVREHIVSAQADETIDCGGQAMFPAFIDNHCHILPTGIDLGRLNLDDCSSREDVLDTVRGKLVDFEPGQWMRAVHYDQTKFADGQHLTSHELDKLSETTPILLRHVNGHASVANSEALRLASIDESTPDPNGGTFARDASGNLTGVLLEKAHELVSAAAPKPSVEEMVAAILLAGAKMRDVGICCAADMMTGQFDLEMELQAYRIAAERRCPIRIRLYLQWATVFGARSPLGPNTPSLAELLAGLDGDRCWVGGIKIFADGAIGSATAAIYGSFAGNTNNQQPTTNNQTSGQLIYSPERLKKMVRVAHDSGLQIAIHSIGDRSTDLVMDAYEALDNPSKHRIEHAMILSDSQIERMARLGTFCTMQPEFLTRFGHSYRRQLGPERASKLKRARSVIDAGIPLSFSSDRPIVGGDPLDGIANATSRPDGFDPSENVTRLEALRGYTIEAARALRDDGIGELLPGQVCEFRLESL